LARVWEARWGTAVQVLGGKFPVVGTQVSDETGSIDPGGAVITELDKLPVITKRGGEMRFLSTPSATGSKHSIFGHLVLQPGEVVPEHVHDYGEETLFVLSGRGVLRAGGVEHDLGPDQCAFLARGVPHAVRVVGDVPLVAVFASAPPASNPQLGHRDLAVPSA
jgi:putative monooxygenase